MIRTLGLPAIRTLAGQVFQWNGFSCVRRQCEIWCICSCIRGLERLRICTQWKARSAIEFYAWTEGDTCIPSVGMASANAGAPEASNAMLTAPATVTILFIIFWAGFGSVHDWTKPTLTRATTRMKKRPYIFKSDDKVRKNGSRSGFLMLRTFSWCYRIPFIKCMTSSLIFHTSHFARMCCNVFIDFSGL